MPGRRKQGEYKDYEEDEEEDEELDDEVDEDEEEDGLGQQGKEVITLPGRSIHI